MSETKRRPGGHPGMRGLGVPGEKAKDFRGSLGKLIRHCKPFYPVICIAILGDLAGVIIPPDRPEQNQRNHQPDYRRPARRD